MSENPLLNSLKIPGETFTIPSGGTLYVDEEIDENVTLGQLHVYAMTAYDEIIIKTPDMLFSGEAVKSVFSRCVPYVKKPERLFVKDVDFLMICLRKVTYGDQFEVSHKHDCADAKQHSYIISINDIIKKTKRLDPISIESRQKKTLTNGQLIQVEPLRFDGYIKMSQVTDITNVQAADSQTLLKTIVDALSSVIVSVDNVVDKDHIREWLEKVPVRHHYEIQEATTNILDWGVRASVKLKCKDCNETFNYNPLLNPISFFSMR